MRLARSEPRAVCVALMREQGAVCLLADHAVADQAGSGVRIAHRSFSFGSFLVSEDTESSRSTARVTMEFMDSRVSNAVLRSRSYRPFGRRMDMTCVSASV